MKKLCILGTSTTLNQAPFNDKSFEFWALNEMYDMIDINVATRWFEVHNSADVFNMKSSKYNVPHREVLQQMKIPIYMNTIHDDIPMSVAYPMDDMIKHFGRKLFRSTVDYELQLAIYEKFDEIHIYGVNMACDDEYGFQKPSCEYWLGRVEQAGIRLVLPDGCDLLKSYFTYGGEDFEKQNDLIIKSKAKIEQLERDSKEFMKNYYLSIGAKDTWQYLLREIG